MWLPSLNLGNPDSSPPPPPPPIIFLEKPLLYRPLPPMLALTHTAQLERNNFPQGETVAMVTLVQ